MQTEEKLAQLEKKITELEIMHMATMEESSLLLSSRFCQTQNPEDIRLTDLLKALWDGKLKIIGVAFIFAFASAFYALSLPNIYTSTLKLIPTAQKSQGGLSSLAAKYGGLASMAGINLGGNDGGNSVEHAVELMNSWHYIEAFVDKNNLKATLMATKGWDAKTNTLLFDEASYDVAKQKWLSSKSWFSSRDTNQEPSSYKTYQKVIKKFIKIRFDAELGVFTISASHYSPIVAFELTEKLKNDINEYFRLQDKKEALSSIQFIENKIENTSNSQMREVFYSMIESHTQKVMMAEISNEYLLKTLIPAQISEVSQKEKPNRSLIVIISTILGGILGVLWILISRFIDFTAFKES